MLPLVAMKVLLLVNAPNFSATALTKLIQSDQAMLDHSFSIGEHCLE